MPPFSGFPSRKTRLVGIPAAFFSELLPDIDHLGEMKVTLYALWFIEQMEGSIRYLTRADCIQDTRFMAGLGRTLQQAETALDDGLARCVARGTLLQATLAGGSGTLSYYFLNSPRGRAAVQALQHGDWSPTGQARPPVSLNLERPNIFRLYEEHIGPLTPMIAETLREAEQAYPQAWIEDAMRIAVENNVRRWRYVDAILRSWQEGGRNEQHRGDSEKDRRRYIEGQFSDFVEH